jgi:hypothetical protein
MKTKIVKSDSSTLNVTTNLLNNGFSFARKTWSILILMTALIFVSCEKDDLDPEKNPDSIIPERFSIDIPSSISSDVTTKSSNVDTLKGDDIYRHLRSFIHVGTFGAKLTEEVMTWIAVYNLSQPLELTIIGDDDNRAKHIKIVENVPFEGSTWQYKLTIKDVEESSVADAGNIAIQVFWNLNPIKGIAIINPYHIDRRTDREYKNTNFRVDYSEAGEMGYEKHMIVSFSGFPLPSPLIEPFAQRKMKMFVGKTGDMISIYGNSEHPNARFFNNNTGFNWAFVAAASESKNISVAEVGLPPMNLDATDRTTLLEMYSINNVFKNQILSVWPGINQDILNAYLYYTQAPGYFAQQGFEQAGTAPSDLYKPLNEKIKTLAPYNPASILNMSINFDE